MNSLKNKRCSISWVKIGLATHVLLLFFNAASLFAKDDVRINILAVNPSDKDRIEASVLHYLPQEIKPEDVLDPAGLEVKFDQEKESYFLAGNVFLEPNETKTIGVRIRNVWVIPEEEIAAKQEEMEKNLKSLEGTEYYATAKLLYDKVLDKLSVFEEEKSKTVGMKQRIELYRSQVRQLDLIAKDVVSIDSMRTLKSNPTIRTAKFTITAENPSEETKRMTVRSSLPKDITSEDIIDKLDFLLLYDSNENEFILEKEDTLEGLEKKKYEITLRDIWYVAQDKIDLVRKQTGAALENLKGSSYEKFSIQQGEFIYKTLDEIVALQEEISDTAILEDRTRAFVLNSSRFELATKKLQDLKDLLLEVPMKRTETALEKIRKAVRSVKNVVDIIRVGFEPNLSTTWLIILGIIAFLFVMAASFYVVWVAKLKDVKSIKKKEKAKSNPPETK